MNRIIRFFLLVTMLISAALLCGGCGFLNTLPEPGLPTPSVVLDARGRVVSTLDQENRVPVNLEDISPHMLKAIVAMEDARFYSHNGIDPIGLGRALYRNAKAGRVVEGGSTITQQLAKNMYLGPERTVSRKLREVVLTVQLERKFTKDEILELYLNQIYFGQGAYGIEMAARTYFSKPAARLNLAESAMLAGIPQAPGLYSPARDYNAARKRQKLVLDRMVELKIITGEQAREALQQNLKPGTSPAPARRAAHFTAEVINLFLEGHPGEREMLYRGGLSIETTLDLDMQEAAERIMEETLAGRDQDLQGALVAICPRTGYVRAMVGGRRGSSEFNRALARRQPGSAMKPFLYTAAIDSGYTAASTITCEPVTYRQQGASPYTPEDYGGGYHDRPMTLKEALYISDNVVAVQLNHELGPASMAEYARRMGVESELRPFLSLALGTSEVTPMEMARSYGTLASGGVLSNPILITRITDASGRVIEHRKPELSRAIDEKTAYIVTDMLKAVLEPGGTAENAGAILGRTAAGKTGTTEDNLDAWFVGYTPDLVAAVYIGYDDRKGSVGATGGVLAAPLWARFMSAALKETDARDFPAPKDIVFENICAEDGLVATPASQRVIRAAFISGTQPVLPCIFGDDPPWGLRASDFIGYPGRNGRM